MQTFYFRILNIILFVSLSIQEKVNHNKFPPDFLFGTATSAYQIEGAWQENGKGENIWDRLVHEHPELILDKSNGDVACDSYRHYKQDIALMKEMGMQFYRFSISWSRILPTGYEYKINSDGIRYYNNVIDTLLENNIIPMITMFHWDLPQPLQDLGGFANEMIVRWFEDYAKVLFDNFGDRVKLWITFNEPIVTCLFGYGMDWKPPRYNSSGIGDYLCAHNIIKAHAKVYHLYKQEYKKKQQGKISLSLVTHWYEPSTLTDEDKEASQRVMDFMFGLYADPIYHSNGDYPQSVRHRVDERSKKQKFSASRLPKFTADEIKYIQGTYDYFALNHYTTMMVTHNKKEVPISEPSISSDYGVKTYDKPEWPTAASRWLKVVPWGFRKLLNYIKNRYGDVEIYVTENGFSDNGEIHDQGRINYHEQYLSEMLNAIYEDKVNVKAYTVWSIIDNFEWNEGYKNVFGLHHVNFSHPDRVRTKKDSAIYFKKLISNWKIPNRKSKYVNNEL